MNNSLVAVVFKLMNLNPNASGIMIAQPQVNLKGPYYLGIKPSFSNSIWVKQLQFANTTPLVSPGTIESILFVKEFFEDVSWPEGLIAINGPNLCIANTIMLELHNQHQYPLIISATVWGTQDNF